MSKGGRGACRPCGYEAGLFRLPDYRGVRLAVATLESRADATRCSFCIEGFIIWNQSVLSRDVNSRTVPIEHFGDES